MNAIDLLPKEDVINLMPESFKDMARDVSFNAAVQLVLNFGGILLAIPKQDKATHRLAEFLDPNDFKTLVYLYGGENITVPNCKAIKIRYRNIQIIEDKNEGLCVLDLTKKYNLTSRHIRTILNSNCKKNSFHQPTTKEKNNDNTKAQY